MFSTNKTLSFSNDINVYRLYSCYKTVTERQYLVNFLKKNELLQPLSERFPEISLTYMPEKIFIPECQNGHVMPEWYIWLAYHFEHKLKPLKYKTCIKMDKIDSSLSKCLSVYITVGFWAIISKLSFLRVHACVASLYRISLYRFLLQK